ncbi:D-alanine-D-alanine ligase [Ferrithrix thermotolerans DSM 19514]|uniref:D-alanine-D-alanine ligase n=1 Tax=Ferrithrix thermotolerans DSM 19514 TaxID=1121881 RepID=A0A1M4S579_9ACTN|nr:hypothetical protein [Ferrithrix thermotolerans]SHE27353.1 D-alanine-D-alanine ligase [Ferrithrix thermotolerans DSM 19514]
MELIGVVFGGRSPEHDISILTGLQAVRALSSKKVPVVPIYWSKQGEFYLIDSQAEAKDFANGLPPKASPIYLRLGSEPGFYQGASGLLSKSKRVDVDIVVNCCHGGPGEDGTLQGIFDQANISYTGPTARAAALGMDKLSFGSLMKDLGVPVLQRANLDSTTETLPFEGPYIVKPRYGGSSLGIDVVEDLATAKMRLSANVHLRYGAVVEPYRADLFDLQLAVRSFPELTLSPLERPMKRGTAGEILSYKDKYIAGEGMATAPRELPAKVSHEVEKKVSEIVHKVASVIGVRSVFRVDFLASEGDELYLNEVNTIPGSLSHYLWIEPKLSFGDQLMIYLEEAKSSPSTYSTTAGADGTVLRSASSVASKLA